MILLWTILVLSILFLVTLVTSIHLCLKDPLCEITMTKVLLILVFSALGIAYSLDQLLK